MKPSMLLEQHRQAIREIVARHRAANARIFGSVLREGDTESSDLDLLVDPTDATTLLDIGAIQVEVSELLGIEVDVMTPGSLPERWRMNVLNEARPV